MFDLAFAVPFVIALLPLIAVIAVAIRLTSNGPSIYVQTRVGHLGRRFRFYKFRTMTVNNDDSVHRRYVKQWMRNQHYQTAENGSATFKIVDDCRITYLGRVLRRYSLDELPQIFNVLKGDMSLVGPRPALEYEVENYKPFQTGRFAGLPGITGHWQVSGRNQTSFDDMVFLDLEYLQNWSVFRDFVILLKTIPVVLSGTGY